MTKKHKLSEPMDRALRILAGQNALTRLSSDKTYMPYATEARTFNALADRGLAEEVFPPKVTYGGFRITKAGWDHLGKAPRWTFPTPVGADHPQRLEPVDHGDCFLCDPPPPEPITHEVTGYSYTRVDCPECDYINYVEGDAKGDTVECENCKAKLVVRSII